MSLRLFRPGGRGARAVLIATLAAAACGAPAQTEPAPRTGRSGSVPRTWEDAALASLEIPLAAAGRSPTHAPASFYERIPVRAIFKSYPIYAPGREPAGYIQWLEQQEPEVAFDPSRLESESDWIAAGELVFDAPVGFGATFKFADVRDPSWYRATTVPVTREGVMPFSRYVIRKKGVVEVGSGACLMCHARIMADGSLLKGAQGNFPADRVLAANMRAQAAQSSDADRFVASIHLGQRAFFASPWLASDPHARIAEMSIEEIAAAYDAIPPGVTTRVNLSPFFPAQVPDLIGIRTRRFLDHTGMVRQRSMADLMRYAALVQGANSLDRFGDFRLFDQAPDPRRMARYSDEQLYALALYLYSIEPPPNPNRFDRLAARGQKIFEREGCVRCHTPPLYTSNKLVPVDGFTPPDDPRLADDIVRIPLGTDPRLALETRKGTGFYKVPALRGVWYRGPFEHSGSVATLEDWFDPRRTRPDYEPSGFRGAGVKRRAVPGHRFGLGLGAGDRRALIAFLRTL